MARLVAVLALTLMQCSVRANSSESEERHDAGSMDDRRAPNDSAHAAWLADTHAGLKAHAAQGGGDMTFGHLDSYLAGIPAPPATTPRRALQAEHDVLRDLMPGLPASQACDDPLAAIDAQSGCPYSCDALKAHYFPGDDAALVSCFHFDGQWPSELTDQIQRFQDAHVYVPATTDSSTTFTIGDGQGCENVTIVTYDLDGTSSEEVRCLVDGEHEHEHTVAGGHSISVLGYAESDLHCGPGGTTNFVVGQCIDVVIRVTTTAAAEQALTWQITRANPPDADEQPWAFVVDVTAQTEGMHEYRSCMYENEYTLAIVGGNSGWAGSVEIAGYVDYQNTIEVPPDGKWIIQGALDDDGLPVELDARISSGTPALKSAASIVLRHIRFSNRIAPLDIHPEVRAFSTRPESKLGGAFYYEGALGATIIFERLIFDHCGDFSHSGGAIQISGRAEDTPGQTFPQAGLHWEIRNSLFYRNTGGLVATFRTVNVWPLDFKMEDTEFIDGSAIVAGGFCHQWYPDMNDPTGHKAGGSNLAIKRTNVLMSETFAHSLEILPVMIFNFAGASAAPGTVTHVEIEDFTLIGYTAWFHNGLFFQTQSGDGAWEFSVEGSEISRNTGTDVANIYQAGALSMVSPGAEDSNLHVMRTIISGNQISEGSHLTSQAQGGGAHVDLAGRAVFEDTRFESNLAVSGGGIRVTGTGTVEFRRCQFLSNTGLTLGGAISSNVGALLVKDSFFRGNQISTTVDTMVTVFVRVHHGTSINVFPVWRIDGPDLSGRNWQPDLIGEAWSTCTGNANQVAARCAGGAPDGSDPERCEDAAVTHTEEYCTVTKGTCQQEIVESTECEIDSETRSCTASGSGSCTYVPSDTSCPTGCTLVPAYTPICDLDDSTDGSTECPDGCNGDNPNQPGYIFGNRVAGCEAGRLRPSESSFCEPSATDPEASQPYLRKGAYYTEVMKLTPGQHTLWHGAQVDTSQMTNAWPAEGWIDVVDIMPKSFVRFVDNRPSADANGYVREESCRSANEDVDEAFAAFDDLCPYGQFFWSYSDFIVPYGEGGAIACSGAGTITVQNTSFLDNGAGEGAALYSVGAQTVDASHTDFGSLQAESGDQSLVYLTGQMVECDAMSCASGQQCTFRQHSRFCGDCEANQVGDGITCTQCRSGTQPNADQTSCEPCEPGARSEIGICQDCEGETLIAATSGQILCDQCPRSTRADPSHTQCLCDTGTYNGTAALHICFYRGYDEEQFKVETDRHSVATGSDCSSCPLDELGDSCLTCEDGRTVVAPGYTVPRLPPKPSSTLSDHISVFRCHPDPEIAEVRCPGGESFAGTRRALSESGGMCAPGYEGYMCGECTEGFGKNSKQECETCAESGFTWATLGGMAAMIGGTMLGIGLIGLIWGRFPLKHVVRCGAQPARILITYSQVTSQLGDVLDFQYPGLFGSVIDALRPIMDVWGLLFRALGPSECFGLQGFTSRWLLRVVGLPLIMSAFVLVVFVIHCCKRDAAYAKAQASGNFFFVVFFCYPTICIVSFAAFICQPLTDSTSVLEIDDAVICEDPSHRRMQWLSGAVIAIIAVGTPVGLLYVLKSKAAHYERETRVQYSDVAKRMSTELKVELHVAEYVIRDIVVGKEFGFLMDAFQPSFLYWEALDMIRKLALVGLVLLVGRGSIAQLSTAIALSFGFFALHMHSWPYKVYSDNMFRAASELHVFIVITTALVLKNNLAIEVVTEDAYDFFLFISFIALVPVAFVVSVINKVRFMNKAVANGLSLKSVEPAEMRRRSFELHLVGLSTDADKENLRRFIDGWKCSKEYVCFLSHYKMEAAAEARIMKAELARSLKIQDKQVFLDADNLTDLRDLLQCVEETDIFILMWTADVLSRPWCLAEINAAVNAEVPILVVQINNSFSSDMKNIDTILDNLPGYLEDTNPKAIEQLREQCQLDPIAVAKTIKKGLSHAKTTTEEQLTFDPNQSSVMVQSQIHALAKAMVKVACPENAALLPDLAPVPQEPWTVARSIAIYIVYAEQDPLIKKLAENTKEWLRRRCDLAPELISLCSDSSAGRSISDVTPGDCDDVADNVDTVLMLQSKQVLADPRSLARLYVAVTNRAPVVPVHLTSSKEELKSKLWDFETAGSTLDRLDEVLAPADAAALSVACGGASAGQVGKILAQVIPNVISKPLGMDGVATQFEAQMLDIELTLRREMPMAASATSSTAAASREQKTAKAAAASKTTGSEGIPPTTSNSAPQPARSTTPTRPTPRARAKVVARAVAKPSGP
jgi:hypothetical protein